MRLLITRPQADAGPLATELDRLGHDSVIEPLLEVHFHELDIDPGRYRAVLATSANGVRALAGLKELGQLLRLDMLAVGPATAREARQTGFEKITIAGGDVAALADKTAEMLSPGPAPLLHISGAAAAGDLKGALEARGFLVERMIGYEARARRSFSPEVMAGFSGQTIDGVLIYSPRTAAIFARLIQSAGLETVIDRLTCFCLSQAVADKLQSLSPVRTVVAAAPNQPALLKLIEAQA